MSLQEHISVNARYTRSANLERDIDSLEGVETYIPTARSLDTLGRIISRIIKGFAAAAAPRAFSLVGPYGVGKSSFAVLQGNGLLLIIDELGKFLEYEARHGANDIYLLQALAEHAVLHQGAPLNLVVLLHQSFEQYAQLLGEALRNEWTKVQGRFENIPFLDPADQTLRIVAAACRQRLDAAEHDVVRRDAAQAATALLAQGALPAAMGLTAATNLLAACYPLHPVAALLLPPLCQRVAQNERTLFSYLADLARVLRALPAGDLSVVCANAGPLREALIEVKAGETLRRQAQELQGDPVAERELREQQGAAERRLLARIDNQEIRLAILARLLQTED